MAPTVDTSTTTSVERALSILETVAQEERGLTHSDISRRLDIPKSTTTYLLRTLESRSYLRKNEDTGRFEGAVDGFVFNRRVFDINGNEITSDILARVGEENDATLTQIPTIRFIITQNSLDQNGEMFGQVFSTFVDNAGDAVNFEEGNYYAVLSGDDAEELVGVIVTQTTLDPSSPGGARDTTGFTIYREPFN